MFDRRKVLGRGVRGGDAPFPEEEAARGNRAASYMQILSLATMHLLHLLLYFALHSTAILHHKWQEHGVREKKCFTVDLF